METIVNVFAENLFKDKSVLITGGGRGIGKEIALSFARLGADVAIASRNKENLEATKKEIVRRDISVPEIHGVGKYKVQIKLHSEVNAEINLEVTSY